MTYSIIGTGAIGGYYGGRLMKAGRQVRFLLHSDYDYVKQNGLQIDSCDGSFHLDNV
jgi:2-dehydropantoate 2-reductase